jgi:hypothetical protein
VAPSTARVPDASLTLLCSCHPAEWCERLGRSGALLLGQPHGDLPVEVEAAADHTRDPPHRVEAGSRGQVREHLANGEPVTQRPCRPPLLGQLREVGGHELLGAGERSIDVIDREVGDEPGIRTVRAGLADPARRPSSPPTSA